VQLLDRVQPTKGSGSRCKQHACPSASAAWVSLMRWSQPAAKIAATFDHHVRPSLVVACWHFKPQCGRGTYLAKVPATKRSEAFCKPS
jgi:hypothetical protein